MKNNQFDDVTTTLYEDCEASCKCDASDGCHVVRLIRIQTQKLKFWVHSVHKDLEGNESNFETRMITSHEAAKSYVEHLAKVGGKVYQTGLAEIFGNKAAAQFDPDFWNIDPYAELITQKADYEPTKEDEEERLKLFPLDEESKV